MELELCHLAAEILGQAIVSEVKNKNSKQESFKRQRRQEEIFQPLQILVFIFNYYEPLPKKIVTRGKIYLSEAQSTCAKRKRE